MKIGISLVAVLVLAAIGYYGGKTSGFFFGVVVPYLALAAFLVGVVIRILQWAKVPVPFRIPTTCGQQKTLDWIKHDRIENPSNNLEVLGRMLLEVLFFRSLFRNTTAELHKGPKLVYGATKWLWLGALAFHYAFLVVLLRHLRFFVDPVPRPILLLQKIDGFLAIGVPYMFITSVVLLLGVTYLFVRRVVVPQVRYISLANDYFPLFLIFGIALSGVLLRHFVRTDIVGVKELTMGLLTLQPVVPDLDPLFFLHLFLVCVLFAYFPLSKLMHAGGVFLSPTRNLANNNRAVRHVNPWGTPAKLHTYAEYEEEFHDKLVQAGIPLDKE